MKTQVLLLLLFLQVSVVSFSQNTLPTVAFAGYQSNTVCTPAEWEFYFVDGMQVYDPDGDTISIVSINSSNTTLLDPSDLYTYVGYPDNFQQSYVLISGTPGAVASPTNVTLSVTFSDGNGGTLTVPYIYILKPAPIVTFLETQYTMCSSLGVVDVNQWVYPQGGYFEINNEQQFDDGIFHTDWVNSDFSLDYTFTGTNGCSGYASVPVTYYEAPQITLYPSNSSSCVSGDGAVDAAIYSPSGTPFTFVWNDGNTTETDRTGLNPGVYHIDVTDQNGCIAEASTSVFLNGVSFNEVIDTVTCYGGNDGGISINVTGMVAPVTMYWSSGHTAPTVSGLVEGTYTVNLEDGSGCAFAASFYVPEHAEMYTYDYVSYPTDCNSSNGSVFISSIYGGVGTNYDVQWSNSVSGWSNYNLSPGIYTATITDNAGCSVERTYIINDYYSPWANINTAEPAHCNVADGMLDMDTVGVGSPILFDWSNGSPTLDLTAVNSGEYTLHLQDLNGCDSYGIFTVPSVAPMLQPICMVSVDSATTTNLVIWEKVDPGHIAYYNIYRETVNQNEFMWIDSVSNNDESIFNDVMASPTVQSWRYRISAVDECGVEGPLSTAHKTMHITTTDLGNGDFKATWNPYYGVDYDFYVLYRYTGLTGWEEIATLPAMVTTYYDTPPNAIDLDYMTELDLNFTCVADIVKAQDFNTTRSNKDKGNFIAGQGTGDSNNSVSEEAVTMNVYPNPVSDKLTIELSANGISKTIYLISVEGQLIGEYTVHSIFETIDMSALGNGLYFVKIQGQNETVPVVKQ